MRETEKARSKRLLDCFKLTIQKWETVDAYQKHVCFICGKAQKSGKRLATDHDHLSGLYRGHLCSFCNKIMGFIDRFWGVAGVIRAFIYLKQPPAVAALGYEHYGWPGRVTTKKHRRMLKRLKRLTE
jgi:hypothetical protein